MFRRILVGDEIIAGGYGETPFPVAQETRTHISPVSSQFQSPNIIVCLICAQPLERYLEQLIIHFHTIRTKQAL